MSISGKSFIPRSDDGFDSWLAQFLLGAANWWDGHGGDGNLDPLRDLRDAWEVAYAASVAADAAARAATDAKKAARIVCEQSARIMVRQITTTLDTTDAQRAEMGITLRQRPAIQKSRIPITAPVVSAIIPARLTHTIRFNDERTPTRTAKPRGVRGAEVWVALVAPQQPAPADPKSYRYVCTATRDNTTHSFAPEDSGKTAAYILRWTSTRGERGPWSEVCAATVAA